MWRTQLSGECLDLPYDLTPAWSLELVLSMSDSPILELGWAMGRPIMDSEQVIAMVPPVMRMTRDMQNSVLVDGCLPTVKWV